MDHNIMSVAMKKAGLVSNPTSIASFLTSEIRRTNMSYQEIKEQSHVPVAIIKDIVTGRKEPDERTLKNLYKALPRLRHFVDRMSSTSEKTNDVEIKENPKPKQDLEVAKPKSDETEDKLMKRSSISFHDALRKEMKKEGVSAGDLAKLLDMSESGVKNWTTGKSAPIRTSYNQILELFPSLKSVPEPPGVRDAKSRPGRPSKKGPDVKPEPPKETQISKTTKLLSLPPLELSVAPKPPPEDHPSNLQISTGNAENVAPVSNVVHTTPVPMNDKMAAFNLGVKLSKMSNKQEILEVLNMAKQSSFSLSELIDLLNQA